jgi:hypothetical protein
MRILHAFRTGLCAMALTAVATFEYIEIDAPDEKGATKHWSIELGSPSILMQSGWKFSTIKAGDKVTLIINPLKSGQNGGFLSQATLADGKVLFNGPRQEAPAPTQK